VPVRYWKRLGRRGDARIRTGITLELAEGDIQAQQGVFAGLGLALGVAGDGRLDLGVGG
jgi:hypothetical protein